MRFNFDYLEFRFVSPRTKPANNEAIRRLSVSQAKLRKEAAKLLSPTRRGRNGICEPRLDIMVSLEPKSKLNWLVLEYYIVLEVSHVWRCTRPSFPPGRTGRTYPSGIDVPVQSDGP